MGVIEGIRHNDKTPIWLACVGGNYSRIFEISFAID
jgi:hypothetical protein